MIEEIYTLKNVPLCEAMYGPGLISLGGYEAVDEMIKGIDLRGKKILDIGSGIGGMAHYLSKKYGALVTGLDIHPWMAKYSMSTAPAEVKERVNFICYSGDGTIPLPSKEFDVIYSKGVLTNVEDKKSLFKELHRLLKSSGTLCLIDWLVPEASGPKHERLFLGDMSFKETQSSYSQILSECGFHTIHFKNESPAYLKYVENLISLLNADEHKQKFSHVISSSLREKLIQSEVNLKASIEAGKQLSFLIRASV
jgi:phosphoethanolamine N-methyltransferase